MASKTQRNANPATVFGVALLCSCIASVAILGKECSAFSFETRSRFPKTTTATTTATSRANAGSAKPKTALPMSDRGWDNDNFLESLGSGGSAGDGSGGNDALERANDEYFRQSRFGRPASVDNDEESRGSSSSPPKTKLGYKEALRRKQEQRQEQLRRQQQQQQSPSFPPDPLASPPHNANDMAAVSDAAAEVYSYSYNKDVAAPSSPPATKGGSTDDNGDDNDNDKAMPPIEDSILPSELVEKAKASREDPKEEASQGGSRFQELMERARVQQQQRYQQSQPRQKQLEDQRKPNPSPAPVPASGSNDVLDANVNDIVDEMAMDDLRGLTKRIFRIAKDGNDERILSELKPFTADGDDDEAATPPSLIMTPEEIANLSIDEQARLYREFFYVQRKRATGTESSSASTSSEHPPQRQEPLSSPGATSMGSSASNYLEAGIGFDGRKIGRNRDADAISNASDVYFAQLKRDSTTRNIARYSGDDAKANDVFHDPSIGDIVAPVNPYLEEERKRTRNVIETVPEEMLVFAEYGKNAPEGRSSSGVSYKDKLLQKKREREEQKQQEQQQQSDNDDGASDNDRSY